MPNCFVRAAAVVTAELGNNIAEKSAKKSIFVPFGQLNLILCRTANSAQDSLQAESLNPGIPTCYHQQGPTDS